MTAEKKPTVAVHTLRKTSEESFMRIVDDGHFITDLADLGYGLNISNYDTYENGVVRVPLIGKNGDITFDPGVVGEGGLRAMYSRIVAPVSAPGSESILKLNPNSMKELAGSKIDLYEKALFDHQVDTKLLSISDGVFSELADVVHEVATKNVVIKPNDGFGGSGTQIMTKKEALTWLADRLEDDSAKNYVIQPQIMFGPLPAEIKASGSAFERDLVERSRHEKLLSELRMYVVTSPGVIDMVPILRVVPEKGMPMKGQNDVYVDVTLPDDLLTALKATTENITERVATAAGGADFILGAVDFYFDEHGLPHVMEANFRNPGLPLTSNNPIAGRQMHKLVAKTLVAMDQRKEV